MGLHCSGVSPEAGRLHAWDSQCPKLGISSGTRSPSFVCVKDCPTMRCAPTGATGALFGVVSGSMVISFAGAVIAPACEL